MFVEHGKHKVAEHTILDVGESAFDEGLRQEEVDQWCLVLREAQRAKALEDAGDAQVVVSAAVDRKTRIPQIVASLFIAFVGFFSVNEKKSTTHVLRFLNLSSQFEDFLTSPVFSSDNSIP